MTDNGLYYKVLASESDIGSSTLYVQDVTGNISQIKLTYSAKKIEQPYQTGWISSWTPKAFITKIQGIEWGKEQIFQISKRVSAPLLIEWTVSPTRKWLTLRITGNKSSSMITLPISTSWTWSTESLTSKNIYSSRLVSEWENILTLSVIEATKNETLSRVEVQVFVSVPEVIKPPIETLPVTPRNPDCIGTSSTTCTGKTEAIVIDRFSEDAIDTSGLDAASKKRIDLIISRIEIWISKMNTSDALDLIESSISLIQSLPNKTKTMKLVDNYTISRLESLRNTVRSGSNKVNDDYIGLIENILWN